MHIFGDNCDKIERDLKRVILEGTAVEPKDIRRFIARLKQLGNFARMHAEILWIFHSQLASLEQEDHDALRELGITEIDTVLRYIERIMRAIANVQQFATNCAEMVSRSKSLPLAIGNIYEYCNRNLFPAINTVKKLGQEELAELQITIHKLRQNHPEPVFEQLFVELIKIEKEIEKLE